LRRNDDILQRSQMNVIYGINVQNRSLYAIHCESEKKQDTLLMSIIREILIDFQNSFTARLSTKFSTT